MNSASGFRTLLVALSFSLGASLAGAALREISCDFSRGIPTDFTLIDADGNTLSPDLAKFGFTQGDAWVPYFDVTEQNAVASSTSWYKTAGTSSDWMILPQLEVVEGATLTWRARAVDPRYRDGYAVYVSETATDPEGFLKETPLFSVKAEEAEWTPRSVDLSKFVGKTVRIAFVNNSRDCSRLFIDDIMAGLPSGLGIESNLPYLLDKGKELTSTLYLTNRTDKAINGFNVTLDVAGSKYDFRSETVLAPGERVKVDWESGYTPKYKGPVDYTLTVSAGDVNASVAGSSRVVDHKVLMEEGTGTWCGFCVRGIVGIHETKEKFPENFIAVAVHSNDVMECDNYHVSDFSKATGLPTARINRTVTIDPNPAEALPTVSSFVSMPLKGALEVAAELKDGCKRVKVDVQSWIEGFYSDADYRVACVVIENDVQGTDARYCQTNGYAGGSEVMGGFEALTNPVPFTDMVFQDVARGALTSPQGEKGSLPNAMSLGETAEWSGEFDLPQSIMKLDNTEVVVYLLDAVSGEVLNAQAVKPGKSSYDTSDVTEIAVETEVAITVNGLEAVADGATAIAAYTVDGRCVARGVDTLLLPAEGLYIITSETPAGLSVRKVVVK